MRRGGGGMVFLLKIPGGGGVFQEVGGAGRVSAANWGFLGGGGGLNIFFRGRKRLPRLCGQYSGGAGAQGAERHHTVIPGDTRMSFPWVEAPVSAGH